MKKKYLIINHHSPARNLHSEETLEFILSIASMENNVSILLIGNAAFQVLNNQNYTLMDRGLLDQTLEAFKLFALQNIYIEQTMFKKIKQLNLNLMPNLNIIELELSLHNLNDLYKQHDIILTF